MRDFGCSVLSDSDGSLRGGQRNHLLMHLLALGAF